MRTALASAIILIALQISIAQNTCYGISCKALSGESVPVYGGWWLSGSVLTSDVVSINIGSGFSFKKSLSPCGL